MFWWQKNLIVNSAVSTQAVLINSAHGQDFQQNHELLRLVDSAISSDAWLSFRLIPILFIIIDLDLKRNWKGLFGSCAYMLHSLHL